MRVVRVGAPPRAPAWRRTGVTAAAFGLVGSAAAALLVVAPPGEMRAGVGVLAAVAALGLGIAMVLAWRARGSRSPMTADEDLVRLLSPVLDDAYLLVTGPRLPGAADVAALLIGPPGVRVLLARAWEGRYRLHGRTWEYDTRSRRGWIACRTNPTSEAARAREAVLRWIRGSGGDAHLPIEAAVVFPKRTTSIVLEEPAIEVVTRENAPWWAARVGRVQRVDAARVERFVAAIVEAGRVTPAAVRPAAATTTRG